MLILCRVFMKNAIYLNCTSGISGNMFLGALLAAGFSFAVLQQELAKLHLGEYQLINEDVVKCGVPAHYFDVKLGHCHEHRHLADIAEIINKSDLAESVKTKAMAVFTELAKAEAKVHETSIEEVHFHEVGAIDTIIDIVGVLTGLAYLQIEKVFVSEVTTGFGFVDCAHGRLSVPAPATANLLQGIPQAKGNVAKELTTPTGAVLVKCLADVVKDMPFTAVASFCGAGKMDLPVPNVLKISLGRVE